MELGRDEPRRLTQRCFKVMDGDEKLSVREWHRETRAHRRRTLLSSILFVVLPVIVMSVPAWTAFDRLMKQFKFVVLAELQASDVSTGEGLENIELLVEVADAVVSAHMWSLAAVPVALLVLAALLLMLLWSLDHSLDRLLPRRRADLRVWRLFTQRETRTVVPAIVAAGVLFFGWSIARFISWLTGGASSQGSQADGLLAAIVDGGVFLIAGLIFMAGASTALAARGSLRRWEVPREHLLRWLARTVCRAAKLPLVIGLVPLVFLVWFPGPVIGGIDTLIVNKFQRQTEAIAEKHGVAEGGAIARAALTLPIRPTIQKSPLGQKLRKSEILWKFCLGIAWVGLLLAAGLQVLLGYVAGRGARGLWYSFGGVTLGLMAASVFTDSWLLNGEIGVYTISVYATVCHGLMGYALLRNPRNAPRLAADKGGWTLDEARRIIQLRGETPPEAEDDPVAAVYRRVGCDLQAGGAAPR